MARLTRDLCEKCFREEEKTFNSVRDFFNQNPETSSLEASQAIGIDVKRVEQYIESGRLEHFGVKVIHQCQTCSKMIKTGVICDECSKVIQKQVSALKKDIEDAEEAKKRGGHPTHKKDSKESKSDKAKRKKGNAFHRLADKD